MEGGRLARPVRRHRETRVMRQELAGPWEAGPGLQNWRRVCHVGQRPRGIGSSCLGSVREEAENRGTKRGNEGRKRKEEREASREREGQEKSQR